MTVHSNGDTVLYL